MAGILSPEASCQKTMFFISTVFLHHLPKAIRLPKQRQRHNPINNGTQQQPICWHHLPPSLLEDCHKQDDPPCYQCSDADYLASKEWSLEGSAGGRGGSMLKKSPPHAVFNRFLYKNTPDVLKYTPERLVTNKRVRGLEDIDKCFQCLDLWKNHGYSILKHTHVKFPETNYNRLSA